MKIVFNYILGEVGFSVCSHHVHFVYLAQYWIQIPFLYYPKKFTLKINIILRSSFLYGTFQLTLKIDFTLIYHLLHYHNANTLNNI